MNRKEAVSHQHSAVSQNQHQKQKRFTTEDTETTEKSGDRVIARDRVVGNSKPQGGCTPVKEDEQDRVRQRAEALLCKIGEACDELERLAEESPEVVGAATQSQEEHKDAYLRLKARLQSADAAPRCRWLKQDGTACRSPQMKKHIYCFAHAQMMEARALALSLPAMEDANAIQIGLMRIQKALIEDTISTKKAGLLLYSMQLALKNVGQVTFGQAKTEELVTEGVTEEAAIRESQHLPRRHRDTEEEQQQNQKLLTTKDTKDTEEEHQQDRRPFTAEDAKIEEEEQQQNQKLLTTEDTESTEGGQGLPLIDTDDADEERNLQPINTDGPGVWKADEEFVPMPDGYGYTRVRFRIEPERRPVQAAVSPSKPTSGLAVTQVAAHGDLAEVHNALLRDAHLHEGPRSASGLLDAGTGAGSVLRN